MGSDIFSRFYCCHYCDEIVEVADRNVVRRADGAIDWECPCCGCHNDTQPTEEE